jgi:hypothetical protein
VPSLDSWERQMNSKIVEAEFPSGGSGKPEAQAHTQWGTVSEAKAG